MRTRFAPSPTGPLHLGHAYSAILAHDLARAAGGNFVLRFEDIDRSRARPEWEALILEDLRWLGLDWEPDPWRQSDRLPAYREALERLWNQGLIYPCSCSRRDIQDAVSAPQEGAAPTIGPDGVVYPGTCRPSHPPQGRMPLDTPLRLDVARAVSVVKAPLSFVEDGRGPGGETGALKVAGDTLIGGVGDVVLARRDMGTSYHLAVVVDDAAQQISHVVRGEDLFEATPIHVLLQGLLGLATPRYHHHRLIRDENGKRLAKRDDARALRTYRDDGVSAADIRRKIGL
ncbi:tRNA glutamyl-Q(34) synthetase GluQRS [Roseivivax sp. CAU 1753]